MVNLAEYAFGEKDSDGAIEILIANQKYFPKEDYTWGVLSQVYSQTGNKKAAIKAAKKAIELAPDSQWYKDNLERIKAS